MEQQLLDYVVSLLGEPGVLIASGLGTLVVLAQVVVVLTPSQKDDEAWAKLKAVPVLGGVLQALASMAPIKKK